MIIMKEMKAVLHGERGNKQHGSIWVVKSYKQVLYFPCNLREMGRHRKDLRSEVT